MGLFSWFPYTNFHELNLDWITDAIKHQGDAIKALQGSGGADSLYTVYNVEDFGAQRDGANDLATVINTIIATKSHAPGVIYIPAGEWRFTEENVDVSIPSGWSIHGDSPDRTRLVSNHANHSGTVFGVSNASFVNFRDFTIIMKGSGPHIMDAFGVGNCALVTFENLRIETEWKAITCQGGNGSLVTIRNCDFVDNQHSAIAWENESGNYSGGLYVENCRFKITPGVTVQDQNTMGTTAGTICALYMYANAEHTLGNVIFNNCKIEGEQCAFYGTYAENVRFINCDMRGCVPFNFRYVENVQFINCTGNELTGAVMVRNTENVDFRNCFFNFAANAISLGDNTVQNIGFYNTSILNASVILRPSFNVVNSDLSISSASKVKITNGLMTINPVYAAGVPGTNQTGTVKPLQAVKVGHTWRLRGWMYVTGTVAANATLFTIPELTGGNERFMGMIFNSPTAPDVNSVLPPVPFRLNGNTVSFYMETSNGMYIYFDADLGISDRYEVVES